MAKVIIKEQTGKTKEKKRKKGVISGKRLIGMKAICQYEHRTEATILFWVKTLDYPAKKLNNRWESDAELIEEWRKKQISNNIG